MIGLIEKLLPQNPHSCYDCGDLLIERMDIIGLIGLFLAIVAFILAIKQLKDAKEQTVQLKEQTSRLDEISKSMSTQFVGMFPDYLPQLINLLKETNKEVLIACGAVTYGLFSDHKNWINYRATIEQLLNDEKKVDMIIIDEKSRENLQREQFSADLELWDQDNINPEFVEKLESFRERYSSNENKVENPDDFVKLLELQQKENLERAFKTAEKSQISHPMGIHYWIIDEQKAFFVIPNFSAPITEVGFFTSDSRLIFALKSLHLRYKRQFIEKS